jgi:tetratricopeptide (TPR) repeat protein
VRVKPAFVLVVLGAALAAPPFAMLGACRSTEPLRAAPRAEASDLEAGIALFQQGKYAEAEAQLRGASGPDASAYLAATLARQKKFGEAEAAAKAALEANPTHELAVAALGEALVAQKKYDDAIARMEAALAKNGDLAYAHYWLGHANYNKRQTDKMLRHFDRFLQLAPNAPEAASVRQLLAGIR